MAINKNVSNRSLFARTAAVFIAFVCLICLLAILGWLTNLPFLATFGADYIPMAPIVAFFLLGLCGLWFLLIKLETRPVGKIIVQIGLIIFFIVVLLFAYRYFLGDGLILGSSLSGAGVLINHLFAAKVSPMTALSFLLIIPAFLAISFHNPNIFFKNIGSTLLLINFELNSIVLIGYLYGAPLFYGGTLTPMAIPTSIAFLCLSIGLMLTEGPTSWPLSGFIGPSIKARLLRTFIPAAILMVLIQGFLSSDHSPININPALRVAVAAFIATGAVIIAIYLYSKNLNSDIEEIDRARLQVEKSLVESELRFRSLFDASPISLWEEDFSNVKQRLDKLRNEGVVDFEDYLIRNPDLVEELSALVKVTDVNQATLNLYGAANKTEMIKNLSTIFPKELNQYFRNELVQIANGAKHFEMENVNQTLDGRRITVTLNYAIVPGYEEDLSKTIVTLVDITGRKLAEKAKQEAEAVLRELSAAIEQSPITTVITDLDGNIVFVNPRFTETTGYSIDEAIGKNPSILKSGEMTPQEYKELWDTIKAGGIWRGNFHNKKKNGDFYWESAVISPVKDEQGVITHFLAVKEDISDRIMADQLHQQTTERLTLATRAGGIGIWDWDVVNDKLNWDNGMIRLYGLKENEFGGAYDTWRSGLLPEDRENADEDIQIALRGEKEYNVEFRVVWPDGSIHYLRALANVQRDENGKALRMIGTNWDITEQKKAEAKILETNHLLEESVVRANSLAQQADMANIAKSEFLANMSHEIRTPMNGVIGMTGLLLDTKLDQEQMRYAEIVRSSGEALLLLINDILDFSKIEAGKLDLEIIDFDLLSLLDDFAATLSMRAFSKGVEFLCVADPDVPIQLKGDPGRLRQILTNLAGNSIKFTNQGEVSIRVSRLSEKDGQVVLKFSIFDTGIGIPADKIGLLFNKFTQVDASTTRKFGGTGLGLAISKQLTELMGGEIGVSSIEGKGSEFWFTVHLGIQPDNEQKKVPIPANLIGVRTLIVDDNATNRELLNARLNAWGMRPDTVDSGPAALNLMIESEEEGDPFKIAILDMQMPEMDGATLGEAIKHDERIAGTHLILLSSLGERGDIHRFEEIGFAGFMVKPLRHTDLFNVLSIALAGNDSSNSPRHILTRHSAREIRRVSIGVGARILLVEDNATNQLVALALLKKLGLKSDAVADGAEAIKALETLPYNLVLMDVQMPIMDGYEATQHIRNIHTRVIDHNIPVIAMTANALQGDRERCLEAGMNDYISKPIVFKELSETLERWLTGVPKAPKLSSKPKVSIEVEQREAAQVLVFDKNTFIERVMGDIPLAQSIISIFLKDIPIQIRVLQDYLSKDDMAGAERQAHSIKGAAANIGADKLKILASDIESSGKKDGGKQAMLEQIPGLISQFNELQHVLEKGISNE
ncbi:MAG: hypothetical protein ACD_34C00224G0005 [uncultured bacterium]|nr:MAG: hypothetical protein ACD_34C00224G0005 [uncultured bacterium]